MPAPAVKKNPVKHPQECESLTIALARRLAAAMIRIADRFPLNFITERDFYPLIHTYLSERLPSVRSEHSVKEGEIDFRTGGSNPALMELAVAPRAFCDPNRPDVRVPGFDSAPQLYPSQNNTELKKLFGENARYANRYLLLLDLRGDYNFEKLKVSYKAAAQKITPKEGSVSVIYARHGFCGRIQLEQK